MEGTARGRQNFLGRFQTTMATAKGFKMSEIVVEFSGWIKADPDKTMFFKVGDSEGPEIIDGTQWLGLDEESRSNYILEDLISAQIHAIDGSYTDIQVTEEN